MSISGKRLTSLTTFKFKELFRNKTFLISVLLVLGLTLIMRLIYANLDVGALDMASIYAYVLKLGVLYSITMIGMLMPATFLAKDKENNTLRTLMTSSVQVLEYFIGGVLPSLVISVVVNVGVLLISGLSIAGSNLALYLVISTLAGFSSCVLGMIVGIFSKNQMSSSNIATPLMLVLLMLPLFQNMVPALEKVNGFLYTGVVSNVISAFAESANSQLSLQSWCVLIITPLVFIAVFIISYRKNGFDHD